ncbi:MAG: hypothetical protein IT434_17195 [Phycisphaerales bacterium]|nr:hypothetical protein [Phycisphaerales bacterium]
MNHTAYRKPWGRGSPDRSIRSLATRAAACACLSLACVVLLGAGLAGAGCGVIGGAERWEGDATVGPFAPVRLRLHPLSHLERDEAGLPKRLVCHAEFQDRWFDSVKACGVMEVQLYRGSATPGMDEQAAKWTVDLTDLEANARWFDPVTRTYRVQLDLPAWTERATVGSMRLRAEYVPQTKEGEMTEVRLRDELVVRY